jgi:DNA mismatch endonuclease (patch repair protein)
MADVFSKKKRSKIMSHIGSKDTKPEVILRKVLHKAGFRYRLHVKSLPGKPDIVLPKYHTIIQVRGCFWHSHNCIDGHIPKSSQDYWIPKLLKNKKRDINCDKLLRKLNWSVIVVWACKIQSLKGLKKEANRIFRVISHNKISISYLHTLCASVEQYATEDKVRQT